MPLSKHCWSLPLPLPPCLSQSLPKSRNSCRSSSSENWALKQMMSVWGAFLSNEEHSQTGNKECEHQVLRRLRVCHIHLCRGGGHSHECKATHGGWRVVEPKRPSQEKILKELVSTWPWKRFLLVALKTPRNITWEIIYNSRGKLKWLKSWLTKAVAEREALLLYPLMTMIP